ncbi:MAG: TolC family protein [Thermodesulfobacteriota bacterium]
MVERMLMGLVEGPLRAKRIGKVIGPAPVFALLVWIMPHCPTQKVMAELQPLELSEALSQALQENRTILYHRLGVDIAEKRLDLERSIYDPLLNLAGGSRRSGWSSSTLDNLRREDLADTLASVSRKTPIGGVASLNYMTETERLSYEFPRLTLHEYTTSLFLKYEQPILRGFGTAITNINIDKAGIVRELEEQRLEDIKALVLFNVFRDYFILFRALEELRLVRAIRKNTEEIYDIVKQKVELRRLPITDLNRMKAALLAADREILEAENRKGQRQHQLMLSIYNDPKIGVFTDVQPTDSPDEVASRLHPPPLIDTLVRKAHLDFELTRLRNEARLAGKDLQKAMDDQRPELTLSLEAGFDGYSFDTWFKSVSDLSAENYRVLLRGTFSLPVWNTAARSRVGELEYRIQQVQILIRNRLGEIDQVVHDLYRDIETMREKRRVDEGIVSLSRENLNNEMEKLVRDKSTVLDTLDYQRTLIAAEFNLINTKVDNLLLLGTVSLFRREMEALLKARR